MSPVVTNPLKLCYHDIQLSRYWLSWTAEGGLAPSPDLQKAPIRGRGLFAFLHITLQQLSASWRDASWRSRDYVAGAEPAAEPARWSRLEDQ